MSQVQSQSRVKRDRQSSFAADDDDMGLLFRPETARPPCSFHCAPSAVNSATSPRLHVPGVRSRGVTAKCQNCSIKCSPAGPLDLINEVAKLLSLMTQVSVDERSPGSNTPRPRDPVALHWRTQAKTLPVFPPSEMGRRVSLIVAFSRRSPDFAHVFPGRDTRDYPHAHHGETVAKST